MPACNAKVCYRLKFELIKNPQIITDIRAMFRKESTERSLVAINELICDVVATARFELAGQLADIYAVVSRKVKNTN
jgi:hypothetical protein